MSEPFRQPIDASTRYCAVFGQPIRHSASPAMQNAGIAALGLNWRYLACEVQPEDLREAIAGAKRMGFVGLNLTVPHKLLAVEMVDVLDDSAKIYGAVNTVRFEGRHAHGGWLPLREFGKDLPVEIRTQGFNTDAEALVQSLRGDLKLELRGAKVLLLGAGGAGHTAALKLAAEGVASLFVVNRTRPKAEAVMIQIKKQFPSVNVSVEYPKTDVDLLLNATSVGLKPDAASPLDVTRFSLKQARAVYDMVYRPADTALLKAAKEAGCRTANGLGMLLYQGAKALEIWSGHPAPVEIMRRALIQNVYGN